MTGWLLDIWCCNSVFNSPDTDMLITDTDMFILDTWSLTVDIWHRYLTCYTWHLIPDTWYLTPVLDMLLLDTWYLTLDIWHRYLTCYHLTPDSWHLIYDNWQLTCYTNLTCFHMVLVHLTRYCDTWLDTIIPGTCIAYSWLSLLRGLGMIIILLPDLWYSWTHVPLYSCIPESL